jgi:hypothetical protein
MFKERRKKKRDGNENQNSAKAESSSLMGHKCCFRAQVFRKSAMLLFRGGALIRERCLLIFSLSSVALMQGLGFLE